MNPGRNKERLLADVLAYGSVGEFREALLSETLGLVRRRRRSRQAWRAACALALVAGLGVLLWRSPGLRAVAPGKVGRPYTEVLSQPLAASAVVSTQPFAAESIIASGRNAEMVQTAPSGLRPYDISDTELLALLGAKPVALVRRAPHRAELVFVNEADEEELFRN
jgi:hypothetical protein